MLSFVVLCCLIFFTRITMNCPLIVCAQKFMDNYMVIICSVIVVQLFYAILNFKQNETKFPLMALKANENGGK